MEYDRSALSRGLLAALDPCLESSISRQAVLHTLSEVHFTVLGKPAMARVHRDFLNLRGPTDVITFPYGEILLCAPVAHERAGEFGHSTTAELLLYGIHGMLHLSGYDDLTPAGFEEMAIRQAGIASAVRF